MKNIRIVFVLSLVAGLIGIWFLISGRSVQVKSMDKLNSEGHYLPFYGYTAISRVISPGQYSFIEEYLQEADSTLTSYIAPLPASSYHVTIFDIFTQRKVPAKYASISRNVPSKQWIQSFINLQNDLSKAKDILSSLKGPIVFTKRNLNRGKLPGQVVYVEGTLSNEDQVSDVRKRLLSVFPDPTKHFPPFHMTLGYIFRDIPDSDLSKIKQNFDTLWQKIPDRIILEPPDITYFENMTEFVNFKFEDIKLLLATDL